MLLYRQLLQSTMHELTFHTILPKVSEPLSLYHRHSSHQLRIGYYSCEHEIQYFAITLTSSFKQCKFAHLCSCIDIEISCVGLDDVTYSDDDIKPRIPQPQVKVEQPPLPIEIPPPQPPPEHLRKKPRAELTADFYDLLAEKGVSFAV